MAPVVRLATTMSGGVLLLASCHCRPVIADVPSPASLPARPAASASAPASIAPSTPPVALVASEPASWLLAYPSQAIGCVALTEADCKRAEARSKNDGRQTQAEEDDVAYAKASVAECAMRRTYVGLVQRLAANPGAVARLQEAQRKWFALTVDDEKARFPHLDESGFYGSVLPMCLGIEEEGQSVARDQVLRASASCREDAASRVSAGEQARVADVALNDVYRRVHAAYAADPKFLAALAQAERTWIAYRDAQVAFAASASGQPDGTCAMRELARETGERADYLRRWLVPREEGDVCAGSYAPP